MANRVAAIKQVDAKRLFKAARDAGFGSAKITLHPDGRIEATATYSEATVAENAGNSWDDILR